MGDAIELQKTALRKSIAATLRALDVLQRDAFGPRAADALAALPEFAASKIIFGFCAFGWECPNRAVLERCLTAGKKLALPRVVAGNGLEFRVVNELGKLEHNRWGIQEPSVQCPVIETRCADLILVPAVAVDRCGRRLGRGGGYYDRLLQNCKAFTTGLVHSLQVVESVPVTAHDQLVQCFVTELGSFRPINL